MKVKYRREQLLIFLELQGLTAISHISFCR